MKNKTHQNNSSWSLYKRLLSYVGGYWYGFLISFIGFAIFGASQAAASKWLEMVVDAVEQGNLDQRFFLGLFIVGVFALRGLGTFIGTYSLAYIARQVIHGIRVDLFEKLQQLPASFFKNSSSGQLLAKLIAMVSPTETA